MIDVLEVVNTSIVNVIIARDEDITFVLKGSSIGSSRLQLKTDVEWTETPSESRFFSATKKTDTRDLYFVQEDLTFRNLGFTDANSGNKFNVNQADQNVNITMTQCNILRSSAESGAVLHLLQGNSKLVIDD